MAKTYTTIPSVSTGDVYTASAANNLFTTVNNHTVPAACVLTAFNASQSFAHATSAAVQFNGADTYDTDDMHSTSVNNTRITVTTPGFYACSFTAQINSTGVTQFLLTMSVNGSGFAESGTSSPISASAARAAVSGIIYVANAEYIEAVVYQESSASAARNLSSARFSAVWIGRAS